MHTKKIYYSDPYQTESDSLITDRRLQDSEQWVSLDPLLFYPGGGGQSADRGWISDLPIKDVKEDSGKYWFLVSGEPPNKVKLVLDWELRFKNMQQHTGQHILSAVFHNLFQLDTVSVHLGQSETLIEFDVESLSSKMIHEAEEEANRIVREHLPVQPLLVVQDELAKYPVRRDVKYVSDPVRLIQIGEYDYTGCGGTHVNNTAEVGLIKITKTEKIRGHIRISALIGRPAYDYNTLLHETTFTLSQSLSCSVADLPERVNNIISEIKQNNRTVKDLTDRWIKEYALRLEPKTSIGYFVLQDLSPGEIGLLAREWVLINNLPVFIISEFEKKKYYILQLPKGADKKADEIIGFMAGEHALQGGGSQEVVRGIINLEKLDESYSTKLCISLEKYFTSKDK